MKPDQLEKLIREATCRAFGCQDASNDAHRTVLAALIRGLENSSSFVLCEPSLVRSTHRPPDVVLICPIAGLHVFEVKGITLEDITGIEPGGQFVVQYASGARSRNPFAQVRNAMFDIRDAAQRVFGNDFSLPFRYWVVLPRISRTAWQQRWGENTVTPRELLFADDLPRLASRLTEMGQDQLQHIGEKIWPADEMKSVYKAFGDSSVLFPEPNEREPRRVRETTLGEMFDEAAETYKTLSDEQQKLSAQSWEKGPRLIRGVAGSGKTVVLANNLARRVERSQKKPASLFEEDSHPPRILAVCFNRTLVPFIQKKIEIAYRQRQGKNLPAGIVEVFSYNKLMFHLSKGGLWRYQQYDSASDDDRVVKYLNDLSYVKQHDTATFERYAYDAIYVDEGQDFGEDDIRLLSELCIRKDDEPSLFVFYDDAQNLYGRKRPNWQSIGLNLVGGRSHVMSECFRNTRQIVQNAFNVLYGSFAENKSNVPTKAFADISTLVEKQLLEHAEGMWHVKFAPREGLVPQISVVENLRAENELIGSRLRWLIEDQEVRPQDILILSYSRSRVKNISDFLEKQKFKGVDEIHVAFDDRDVQLGQRGRLTLSTVASAKGYDAYCALLASANDFPVDVRGRASFYVGCTRAIEYLEVMGWSATGLLLESMLTQADRIQADTVKMSSSGNAV